MLFVIKTKVICLKLCGKILKKRQTFGYTLRELGKRDKVKERDSKGFIVQGEVCMDCLPQKRK